MKYIKEADRCTATKTTTSTKMNKPILKNSTDMLYPSNFSSAVNAKKRERQDSSSISKPFIGMESPSQETRQHFKPPQLPHNVLRQNSTNALRLMTPPRQRRRMFPSPSSANNSASSLSPTLFHQSPPSKSLSTGHGSPSSPLHPMSAHHKHYPPYHHQRHQSFDNELPLFGNAMNNFCSNKSTSSAVTDRSSNDSSSSNGNVNNDDNADISLPSFTSLANNDSNNNGNSSPPLPSNENSGNSDSNNNDDKTSKDYYFDSYAHHGIHEEMLKDEVRTRTYQLAILNNAHLFKNKIVLDVGCGTGILSMFASQAGAKHVYAVDCSSIIDQAQQIINKNGFADKITLIKGKVEEIELPVKKVDIIISEWMGYFLLYESMLDTVLYARDKWLVTPNNKKRKEIKDKNDDKDNVKKEGEEPDTSKDGADTDNNSDGIPKDAEYNEDDDSEGEEEECGIIFPDKAVMYICAMEDAQVKHERIDFWDNVYGFDMSPIKEIAYREPVVDIVDPKTIVSSSEPILNIDILTCTKEQLQFSTDFALQVKRNDYIHGFCAYFECAFTQIHKPIGFTTSPFSKYTHWKQTIFYMKDVLTVCDGETIFGKITCKPNTKNPRDLDISMQVDFDGKHSKLRTNMEYKLR